MARLHRHEQLARRPLSDGFYDKRHQASPRQRVRAPTSERNFAFVTAHAPSASWATRRRLAPTMRSTQSRLRTPARRSRTPAAGHRAPACTSPPSHRRHSCCVTCAAPNRYLSFDDCDKPDYDASSVKNDVFLSGSCKSAGFRGSAWQFDNHFLLIDGIGGYFGGPLTLAIWFRLLKSPAQGADSLILGIGVRGSVLNMGLLVSSRCAAECDCSRHAPS